MPIKRRNSNIAIIPTNGIKDHRLSLSARGLLAYLYVMPDGTDIEPSHLGASLGDPRTYHIRALLSELADARYLRPLSGTDDFILLDEPLKGGAIYG
jgi:hypothetical protein